MEENKQLSDEQLVARLIQLAGRRRPVPAARAARVRVTAHAEWERKVSTRRRAQSTRRLSWSLAAAASLILSLGLAAWQLDLGPWAPAAPVASVERAIDTSRLFAAVSAAEYVEVRLGEALEPGAVIETTARSLVALRLASGHSVRLGHGTRLHVRSGFDLYLDRGEVYVDSGVSGDGREPIEIHTPFGVAREIGTQFEVRLQEDSLRLRVREGVVDLEHAGGADRAEAGSELSLDSHGAVHRGSVPIHGPEWEWTARIAPTFVLDGQSLDAFMLWVTRETGLQVLYTDASTAEKTLGTILTGSIESLTPVQALAAVLPTCGLDYRIEGGTVIVELQNAEVGVGR